MVKRIIVYRDVNIDYSIRRKRFIELNTIFYENLITNVQNCKELHFKKNPLSLRNDITIKYIINVLKTVTIMMITCDDKINNV